MRRLHEKIALVTGAGKGIGRATVELFAEEGATVVAVARTGGDLEAVGEKCQTLRMTYVAHAGDVTDETFVARIFADTRERFGRLDILVNNAGIAPIKSIDTMSVGDYRRCLDVNITGVFLCMQQAVRLMKDTTHAGKIINIGSVRSHWTENGDAGAYNASKFGLKGMTESVARELHGTGCNIAVGMVCPGSRATNLL